MFKSVIIIIVALLRPIAPAFAQSALYTPEQKQIDGEASRWLFAGNNGMSVRFAVTANTIVRTDSHHVTVVPKPMGFLRLVVSQSGDYFALVSLKRPAGQALNILHADVYEAGAKLRYSVRRERHTDDPLPQIALLSRSGRLILGTAAKAELTFFSGSGALEKEVRLFPDAVYDNERVLVFDTAEAAQRMALLATRRNQVNVGDAPYRQEAFIILLDMSGQEIWRRKLPFFSGNNVKIAPDGRYIVVNNYGWSKDGGLRKFSEIYDHAGNAVGEFDVFFQHAVFSENANFLVLAEKNRVLALDPRKNVLLWQREVNRAEGLIADIALSGDARRVVLLQARSRLGQDGFLYERPWLQVFDQNGSFLQRLSFPDRTILSPAVHLAKDGKTITLGFKNSLEILREGR